MADEGPSSPVARGESGAGRPPMGQEPTVVLVTTNIGERMGGEAIKAFQYARHLERQGREIVIVSHARCRAEIERAFPETRALIVEDDWLHKLLWRVRPLRGFLGLAFHRRARQLIDGAGLDPAETILHYIAPISPVARRLPPAGFRVVMGPLSGNISHPPALRHRMGAGGRVKDALHAPAQRLHRLLFGEKRRAERILVSGYERTRASLRLAGATDAQMVDVVDAGVNERFRAMERARHEGPNPAFLAVSRLIPYKGVDLAIRAVAEAGPPISLSIYGDGVERGRLEALAEELGVAEKIAFHGYVDHETLMAAYRRHRAFLFPSLAEANGIVMQEAMMIGIPVIALRWGGPERLASDDAAVYVEPVGEAAVVSAMAAAMRRLAEDGAAAEAISERGREIAEARFTWEAVAASWQAAYAP